MSSEHRPRVLADVGVLVRDRDRDELLDVVELVDAPGEGPLDEAALIGALAGCRGLIRLGSRLPAITRQVLESAPDLELVGVRGDRFGTGVDLAAAGERGVRVVDTDNVASAPPVAEWVLALMLACLRNAGAVMRQMMAGTEQWAQAGNDGQVSGELTGQRVGLVGCGHVGQRLVELLAPFRVDLLVCDPYMDEALARELGLRRGPLDQVLEHADILVVQVPHTPRTEKMIGPGELDRLGPGRIIVNCCRGPVVDQQALEERLAAGQLVAGLDVFDPEPLPGDSPLRSMPNAIITPHIAWYAPNGFHRYFATMAREFIRYFTGGDLQQELTQRMVDIRHGLV